MENIIELLKDDSNYYGGVGKNYLSNSDIGALLTNPKMFGVSKEDNKNFLDGRYFHQLLIEPDKAKDMKFVDTSTRTTKEYKQFLIDNDLPIAMLVKEKLEIENLVSQMKSNLYMFENIYRESNQYEVPAVAEIKGLMWKGKADIINHDEGLIVDLKTTSDLSSFPYSAKKYNYDSQAYIYKQLFGYDMIFMAIDKTTHQIGIFDCSENFLANGEDKVKRAVEAYDLFYRTEDFDPKQFLITKTL
jgi:hypothetical protein